MIDLSTLVPGDCLLYRPSDVFGWVTAVKTWARVAHVEVYAGDGNSYASRNGIGINQYAFRRVGLAAVLRLGKWNSQNFSFDRARTYFEVVRGQKYDWKGLLCFTLAVRQGANDRQFCSEFATNFYRAGGAQPFAPDWNADEVSPAQFLQSPAFETVTTDGGPF